MKRIASVLTVSVLLLGGAAFGDVPTVLNFTGSLQTESGPYEGPANVTLAFYPDQTTTTPLWFEAQEVYVQGGRFYVLLGMDPTNPLPASIFNGEDLYLGIQVDENPEMTPRLRVASVPYAMRAGDAGLLGGLPPSAFSLVGHTHAFGDLTGQVAASQLPDSVVLSGELTDILGGYVTVATFSAALAGKSDVGHLHAIGDVTGLQAALDGKAAADHNHDAAYVNVGEADSVTSAMIVDGTIAFSDIAANGCQAGQVMKRGTGVWECAADNDTTYTAGTGLTLNAGQFSVVQTTIEGWARGVCYDSVADLQAAVPGWDQDASNDLTTTTQFGGDVSGKYDNIQIAAGAVGTAEIADGAVGTVDIADSTVFASVRNSSGTEQFRVTDGNSALRFSGTNGVNVTFDAGNHGVDISTDKTTIQNWAQEVCYNTPSELQAAVPGWDQDASNDLTTATTFGGDVTGTYNNLQLGNGTVGSNEIADATRYVSVQNSMGAEQFSVTDGNTSLRFTAGQGLALGFNAASQEVTVSPDFNVVQRRVSGQCNGPTYLQSIDIQGGVTCGQDSDTLKGLSCPGGGGVARNNGSSWSCVTPLPISNGGTNSTASPTLGAVAYGTGTAYAFTSAPAAGNLFLRSVQSGAPVWGSLQANDLPGGSTNYIQNQQSSPQAGANFHIAGNGHIGGELWVGTTARIRLHNTSWTGSPPATLANYGLIDFSQAIDGQPLMRVGAWTDTGDSNGRLELMGLSEVRISTGSNPNLPVAVFDAAKKHPSLNEYAVNIGHGFHNMGWDGGGIPRGATIAGGGTDVARNRVTGDFGVVGGGRDNRAGPDVGGSPSMGGTEAVVAGGLNNVASGTYSFVGGGQGNTSSGLASTISGGLFNQSSNDGSTVGGGSSNIASNYYATVAGGSTNEARGYAAVIGGGTSNEAFGHWSMIPGGMGNLASGDFSFAAGRRAKAGQKGCFVWGDATDNDIACMKENEFVIRAMGGLRVVTKADNGATVQCSLKVMNTGGTIYTGSWDCVPF